MSSINFSVFAQEERGGSCSNEKFICFFTVSGCDNGDIVKVVSNEDD